MSTEPTPTAVTRDAARQALARVDGAKAAGMVFEALGRASMCWEAPENAGVFQSERAAAIGRGLLEALGFEIPAGYREREREAPAVWTPGVPVNNVMTSAAWLEAVRRLADLHARVDRLTCLVDVLVEPFGEEFGKDAVRRAHAAAAWMWNT